MWVVAAAAQNMDSTRPPRVRSWNAIMLHGRGERIRCTMEMRRVTENSIYMQ